MLCDAAVEGVHWGKGCETGGGSVDSRPVGGVTAFDYLNRKRGLPGPHRAVVLLRVVLLAVQVVAELLLMVGWVLQLTNTTRCGCNPNECKCSSYALHRAHQTVEPPPLSLDRGRHLGGCHVGALLELLGRVMEPRVGYPVVQADL